MNDEKTNISMKFGETANAMLIVTVVFGFLAYIAHTIMAHQEKIARIKNEK